MRTFKHDDLATLSTTDLRAAYREIRERSEAPTAAAFDAAVKARNPTAPLEFVRVALEVEFKCRRCAGTGQFITGTVNGKPVGPGGECYRCEGKGVQDDADVVRNHWHDVHYVCRSAS